MIGDSFPAHTLLSQLTDPEQASALQYESAVNALLAKFLKANGKIIEESIYRPGFFRWVPYDNLVDDIANGWLPCDGSVYAIATYPALAAKLQNLYGGDGISTFAVPNVADRVIVGYGSSATLGTAVGATGGSINHQHTINAESAHTHQVTGDTGPAQASSGGIQYVGSSTEHSHHVDITSGPGSAHTHTESAANQAFVVFKGLIKT